MGMTIGLMPKGNLTAVVISAVVLATQANLAAAGLSTALFTWAAGWTDPLAHRLGSAILAQPSCQNSLARLYEWPLMSWTALNNTVVLGSLVLSLLLFYPAYHLVWLAFHHPSEGSGFVFQGSVDRPCEVLNPEPQTLNPLATAPSRPGRSPT